MFFDKLQRIAYPADDSAWCDGRTCELIKFAPILFDLPAIRLGIAHRLAIEPQYPRTFCQFQCIAQPRCLSVVQRPAASDCSIPVHATTHPATATITIRRYRGQDNRARFTVHLCDIAGLSSLNAECF